MTANTEEEKQMCGIVFHKLNGGFHRISSSTTTCAGQLKSFLYSRGSTVDSTSQPGIPTDENAQSANVRGQGPENNRHKRLACTTILPASMFVPGNIGTTIVLWSFPRQTQLGARDYGYSNREGGRRYPRSCLCHERRHSCLEYWRNVGGAVCWSQLGWTGVVAEFVDTPQGTASPYVTLVEELLLPNGHL